MPARVGYQGLGLISVGQPYPLNGLSKAAFRLGQWLDADTEIDPASRYERNLNQLWLGLFCIMTTVGLSEWILPNMDRGPHSGKALRAQDMPAELAMILEECRVTLDPLRCWEVAKPYQRFAEVGAHRWIAAWRYGSVPAGRVVRHSCDNAKCINPRHLVIGSQAENVYDMIDRGRVNRASRSARTKAQWDSGQRSAEHLQCREAHPRNQAVLAPDGTRYANAALAAEAVGITRQAMSHRCRLRRFGWRYE